MMKNLLQSRVFIHVSFWVAYFLLFGFIWESGNGYIRSYFLEFILLPIRIGASYLVLYWLLPKLLLKKKFLKFSVSYLILLVIGGGLQQIIMHFFYMQEPSQNIFEILNATAVLRAIILINSTVIFLLALKVLKLYFQKEEANEGTWIEIKSNKRFYKISINDIVYLQGLSNYVTYILKDGSKIISYNSMKKALKELPESFIRIHKSYAVNSQNIISYNKESIEVRPKEFLPIGNSYSEATVENLQFKYSNM